MLNFKVAAVTSILAMSLTACTSTSDPEIPSNPKPETTESACGADKVGSYVGQPFNNDLLIKIKAESTAQNVRVLHPGSAMTMDYRPDRLNIHVDANGRIEKMHCN